jgi:hypothetical protein
VTAVRRSRQPRRTPSSGGRSSRAPPRTVPTIASSTIPPTAV